MKKFTFILVLLVLYWLFFYCPMLFAVAVPLNVTSEEVSQYNLTSDRLTEIELTYNATVPYNTHSEVGSITQEATIKLSGYLHEINPDSSDLTRYADRAFELENGTVEWTIRIVSDDGDPYCHTIETIISHGKDAISNLNIPYDTNDGRDSSGKIAHLDIYDIKFKYVNSSLVRGKPELSVVGSLLIPVNYTTSLFVTKKSAHVDTICGGSKVDASYSRPDTAVVSFPLSVHDFNIDHLDQGSNFDALAPGGSNPEWIISDPTVAFSSMSLILVTDITVPNYEAPWHVSWTIEAPGLGYLHSDDDHDGLSVIEEMQLGTDPRNPDTDGDGLLDGWEAKGVFKNGALVVDLPSMGADPLHKDLFVEVDWMADATHSHKPKPASLQRVVNAFRDHGINLHFDDGAFGGGNAVAHQTGHAWSEFDFINDPLQKPVYLAAGNKYLFDIKKANFDKSRIGIFYYALFTDYQPSSSGQAEMGGNFYIALPENPSVAAESGTVMHEFGHTLQLGHGGRLSNELEYDNSNYKPNYHSIMNYFYQFSGVPSINPIDPNGNFIYLLDYSEEALPSLDESGLVELIGVNWPANNRYVGYYSCTDQGNANKYGNVLDARNGALMLWFRMNGSAVDWDCDGTTDLLAVATNVNGNGGDWNDTAGELESLAGRSDWDKIVLQIGCPAYGISDGFGEDDILDVTMEHGSCPEHVDDRAKILANSHGVEESMPPVLPFLGEACDGEDNNGDGRVDEFCPDRDSDGVIDELDNCPTISNPDQKDSNHDHYGDACDITVLNPVQKRGQSGSSSTGQQNQLTDTTTSPTNDSSQVTSDTSNTGIPSLGPGIPSCLPAFVLLFLLVGCVLFTQTVTRKKQR